MSRLAKRNSKAVIGRYQVGSSMSKKFKRLTEVSYEGRSLHAARPYQVTKIECQPA